MKCPVDQSNMEKVTLDSKYSSKIIVDQCSMCGGIWFDDSELFLVKENESGKIKNITSIDNDKFKEKTLINSNELRCPKDNNILVRYKDAYLPEKILIMRCPCCNGLWLNKAEFAEFQTYRSDIADVSSIKEQDREFEYEMNKYLNQYSKESLYNTLGGVGGIFSTPIRGRWSHVATNYNTDNSVGILVIAAIARILLYAIFRK